MSVDSCTVQNTVLRNMCARVQVHTSKQCSEEGTGVEGKGKAHVDGDSCFVGSA